MSNSKQLKVILSGGGTGGHIFPAVAIANELKRLVPDVKILFVGAQGKMEMEKVPAAGYEIIGIPIAGLQRRFTWSNFKLPFLIILSLIKTKKIIAEFKPNVVVGTGGFASGPILRAASNKGIPVLIQEQNSYAGITNKILAKKASLICVAYEGMEKFFPKEKIVLTGNPVRQDIINLESKRSEALKYFKLNPELKTILVIGGSLGAKTINEAIGQNLKLLAEANIQLIWQTGKGYLAIAKTQTEKFESNGIFAFDFISKMDMAYASADLVISRAGASSVSELCNCSKPSILVPSPNVAEDHQTKNAMALVNKNAAILIKDTEARDKLIQTAIQIINDKSELNRLSENISKMAFLNSAQTIAKHVLQIAGYTK
ncbi:MAG: undecaprenyldiphospho-muramoylpentapeptide beta-N-acetylglucosaminyltransferase [Sphingobacteriaceae bacterium]|nr:undecaprenyldiphospho-muramoylpentapeptide beta-N-acetylglucosaminyltransferase [Sphingobacteriaceae bacterium]